MSKHAERFVFGVDLDGVCADFYERMREIAAEWLGRDKSSLTTDVEYGLRQWGLREGEYTDLHRFAVTQRELFSTLTPMAGAAQSLRLLSKEDIRIRIITHRLFIPYLHEIAVSQTVRWLDKYAIPYWDLCFMRDKGSVGADLYIDDTPDNITDLRESGKSVIVFSNSTNRRLDAEPGGRCSNWEEAESMVRDRYYYPWLESRGHKAPPERGLRPLWSDSAAGSHSVAASSANAS